MTEFLPVIEFSRDLKKLNKKYESLNDDLKNNFCDVLEAALPNHLPGTIQISGLGEDVKVPIYKVKHFKDEYEIRFERFLFIHAITFDLTVYPSLLSPEKSDEGESDKI